MEQTGFLKEMNSAGWKRRLLLAAPLVMSVWYFWCVAFTFGGNDIVFVIAILASWIVALNQSRRGMTAIARIGLSVLLTITTAMVIQLTAMPARICALRIWSRQQDTFANTHKNGTEFHPRAWIGPFRIIMVRGQLGHRDLVLGYGFSDEWGISQDASYHTRAIEMESHRQVDRTWTFYDATEDWP